MSRPKYRLRSFVTHEFCEWAAEYGEIFYLKLGGQDVIVLNSAEAADELLARRSNNYSGRLMPHVAGSILRGGLGITFLKDELPWKVGLMCGVVHVAALIIFLVDSSQDNADFHWTRALEAASSDSRLRDPYDVVRFITSRRQEPGRNSEGRKCTRSR